MPALRKQVAADMERRGTSREKVVACVIKVLDKGYLRIGTPKYARQYRSYGRLRCAGGIPASREPALPLISTARADSTRR
ncbi:hypothetical protein [Arthrobacter sp. JCM 19049]|uniref:hypothetical protein n=1 Tax=Arthrobacter sp. JCM 19049 TaxID=1460643 RepID=UPI00243687ED|nr:hypothetical protein [Arthrobacter sp. JCM 19049]